MQIAGEKNIKKLQMIVFSRESQQIINDFFAINTMRTYLSAFIQLILQFG